MDFLEGGDAVREAQSQADVVKAFEQAFASEGIDLEGEFEPKVICKGLILEVNGQPVSLIVLGPLEQLVQFGIGQCDQEHAILEAIVIEDVGVAGRDNGVEAVIEDRPGSVLAAGAAAKVGARQQN